MAEVEVNARGLLCPMPVIRAQEAIAGLAAGDHVHVYGTDPGMRHDIPAWCRVHGHRILATHERGGEVEIVIEVGGAGAG